MAYKADTQYVLLSATLVEYAGVIAEFSGACTLVVVLHTPDLEFDDM